MPDDDTDLAELLVERVAAHFGDATVEGPVVRTGLGDLTITAEIGGIRQWGDQVAASLFFHLRGTPLGPSPAFASMSGYAGTAPAAVVEGACLWTCTVRPLLHHALGLVPPASPADDVVVDAVVVDGRRMVAFSQGLDRAVVLSSGVDGTARSRSARDHLPPGTMTASVLRSGALPVLGGDHAVLLSTFVSCREDEQITEVKVGGGDWPPAKQALTASAPEPPGAITFVRELAVVVPRDPGHLTRDAVQGTLDQLAQVRTAPHQAAGWRGWRVHGGRLGPALSDAEVDAVEREVGPLPADHRSLLTEVAGSGAGPGYGLLAPRRLPDGVLLAEAGSGPHWVLRADGTVWLDARAIDGTFAQVAGSSTRWYAAWLTSAVADAGPWTGWDHGQCPCVDLLGRLLDAHPSSDGRTPDLSAHVAAGGVVLRAGTASDPATGGVIPPSHACSELFGRFGLGDDVFASGAVPTNPAPRRWWRRR